MEMRLQADSGPSNSVGCHQQKYESYIRCAWGHSGLDLETCSGYSWLRDARFPEYRADYGYGHVHNNNMHTYATFWRVGGLKHL